MFFTKILTLFDGKRLWANTADVLLLKRNTFASDEDLYIPVGETLILNCPVIDGDITVDGEEYIL
jgi:hypothetical protein